MYTYYEEVHFVMTEQMKEAIIKARKEVKEETDLKKRASLAKERLKLGYWTQLAVERADVHIHLARGRHAPIDEPVGPLG